MKNSYLIWVGSLIGLLVYSYKSTQSLLKINKGSRTHWGSYSLLHCRTYTESVMVRVMGLFEPSCYSSGIFLIPSILR